ncbi:amino acid transporter [Auriculariales sp. MPI-PUGE-AT-0066]|nr:amino acid transporter [Auriculariales sp. MPI-PUGE-AT-0066]
MPSRSNSEDGRDAEPLLPRGENNGQIIFTVTDDDDDGIGEHTRVVDRVPLLNLPATPLRSTLASREAEFDLDDDNLDDDSLEALRTPHRQRGAGRHLRVSSRGGSANGEQAMPLLVGLVDASAYRSPDTPRGTSMDLDLELLASRRMDSGGGMLDSVANMANSILGAGIIGLPYALNQAGFVAGIILLVVLCGVTDWTIRLIVINAKLSGRISYLDVMDRCFGPSGRAAVSFFQFAFAFGGMCAFGIIIGDTIPHVIRSVFPGIQSIPVVSLLGNRQFVIALCTIGVSYPLSLYRDIAKLSRASGLALVGMVIIVGCVMFEDVRVAPELKGPPEDANSIIRPGILPAIGVISFAFVCHHNSLLIYGSMRTPTLDRFTKVTHISTVLSLVACLALAISGFRVFTSKTQGNILNNFAGDDAIINVARFCFGLNMFTTLPLELFVCREVLEQYFFSHESFNQQRHVLFTTALLFAAMFISLITCDLGVTLEIVGGVAASALAFIFPAACHLKLLGPDQPLRTRLPSILCVTFGCIVLLLSLVLTMAKAWDPVEGEVRLCN